jgi:acetate kinase
MSHILVVNAGSQTQKYALYQIVPSENAGLHLKDLGHLELAPDNRDPALALKHFAVAASSVVAIGHRIVHGGANFRQPQVYTIEQKEELHKLSALAPLHNPPALFSLEQSLRLAPLAKQVLVFDTGFHATLDESHYLYPLSETISRLGIRRFGFHGISHKHCLFQTNQLLRKAPQELSMISCHLGGGASLCAIENGISIDTTMGFTPLDGIMMGTRSGAIDPGIIFHLLRQSDFTAESLENLLVKESGLLGISKLSSDMQTLLEARAKGNAQAQLAINMYTLSAAKGIGAMAGSLKKLDAISFTGGIGYNSSTIRKEIIDRLHYLNLTSSKSCKEEKLDSLIGDGQIKLCKIKADEEYMIAKECLSFLETTNLDTTKEWQKNADHDKVMTNSNG